MSDLIKEFLDEKVINSLSVLLSSSEKDEVYDSAVSVANAFGSGEFKVSSIEDEHKLISSFQRNLSLLVEKTWVEQLDISLKEEVLYKLEQFCSNVKNNKWLESYSTFTKILNDVIYLMFGAQSRTEEFGSYALRIDPEFGVFCWYVKNLPEMNNWSEVKNKMVQEVAMFFLANY